MKKRTGALLLALCMIATALGGCAEYAPAIGDQANYSDELISPDIAETENGEQEAPQSQDLPMDPTVMRPWINSVVYGMVTEETEADIKDDLYLAVNKDWTKNVKFRPGYALEMRIFEASDIVKERCESLLADKTLLDSEDPQVVHDASLIQGIYELFLDWDSRNQIGITPFEPIVEKLLAVGSLDELTEYLLSEDNFYWGEFPASVELGRDPADSGLYNVKINPTGLLVYGDPAEYKEETPNGRRSKEFSDEVFTYMLGRFGIEGEEAEKYLRDSYAFEEQIAASEKTVLEQYSTTAIKESINPVTMEDIKEMSPDFPLGEYMERYGYADSKLINLNEPEWLPALNAMYTEEHLDEFKAYTLRGTVSGLITLIDEEAYRKNDELFNGTHGIEGNKPDEEVAYELAREIFRDSFARLYIDRYLNAEIKAEITGFCEDAVETYREMLSETEWLSEETRKEAINKLDHLKINAVYPEKWEDDSMYHVTGKEDGGTYIDALNDIRNSNREKELSKINGKVDRELWDLDILETNAFYSPEDNSINIIPGFFCDASYRSDMSIEEKYGALGSVIGHEISHAFDTDGAQYDADGNYADWWTEEDYAAFMERAGKLVDYYDQVVAFDDGTPYNGQMVQTEAIADMAGLKCMLKMAEKIDGFDYKKFFEANARIWAEVDTLEAAESKVMSDSHPIHYLRANVSAQQFDEFLDTYDIKPGDGMYLAPEDRIAVW